MDQQQQRRDAIWTAAAPLAYALVFLARSYPLALHWREHLYGHLGIDQTTQLWLYWWTRFSLLDSPQSFLFSSYQNHPVGVDITGDYICFLHALLSVPLQAVFGLVGAVNTLYLLSYVMSSVGTFLLARHLSRSNAAAFVAGLVVVHNPYFASIAGLNTDLHNIGFLALFVLYMIKSTRHGGWRYPVVAGLMLALASLENMEHGLFAYLFLGFHMVHTCLAQRSWKLLRPLAKRLGLMLVVFTVLVAPWATVVTKHLQQNHPMDRDWTGKAEALEVRDCEPGQVDPNRYKTEFTGKMTAGKLATLTLCLALVTASLLLLSAAPQLRYWMSAALLFLIMSSGGAFALHWTEQSEPALQLTNYPYVLLHDYLPLVWRFSWPDRLVRVTILCLGVLLALGLVRAGHAGAHRRRRRAAAVVLVLATLVGIFVIHWERWQLPPLERGALASMMPLTLPATPFFPPAAYLDLGREPGDFAVLVLPPFDWTGPTAGGNHRYAHQTVMAKRLVNCHIPPFKVRFQISCAVLDFNRFLHTSLMDPRPLPARPVEKLLELRQESIKYVVVEHGIPIPWDRRRLRQILTSWFGPGRDYPGKHTVYRVY